MAEKLTQKQTEILKDMWSAWFARSMTLLDYSPNTIRSLEDKGLITFDWDTKASHGAPMYGLTHYGFSYCENAFGPREKGMPS